MVAAPGDCKPLICKTTGGGDAKGEKRHERRRKGEKGQATTWRGEMSMLE